jgi:hypothetical protein
LLVGLLITLSGSNDSDNLAAIVAKQEGFGLTKLHKLILDLSAEKPKEFCHQLPSLPCGFDEFVSLHKNAILNSILERYLKVSGRPLPDERDALLRHQQERLCALESDLQAARSDLVDIEVCLNSTDKDFVVRENMLLRNVARLLKKEAQTLSSEAERLRKIRSCESNTYRDIIEDLQSQVNALLLNNKQLSELHVHADGSPPKISLETNPNEELLELLRVIYERFPETRSLIGPLGKVDNLPDVAAI